MNKFKIAVLDDYQNVALKSADWSVLRDRADIAVFQDHLADPDAVIERLLPFDVVCVMRERTPLPRNVIDLEGQDLVSVPLGFTDTAGTTCLHVPSIGLIAAGDAAYNGVHLHLSESPDQQKRQEWIAALDKMESLKPRAVIAGHKRVGNVDSPKILGETRKYIRDFERLAMQTTTARELYDQMLKLYPDWGNPGALWTSVRAVKP